MYRFYNVVVSYKLNAVTTCYKYVRDIGFKKRTILKTGLCVRRVPTFSNPCDGRQANKWSKMCIFLQFVAKVDYIVNKCCYWLNTFGEKIRNPSPLSKRILAKLYIIYKYKTLFSVTFLFQLFKIYCV